MKQRKYRSLILTFLTNVFTNATAWLVKFRRVLIVLGLLQATHRKMGLHSSLGENGMGWVLIWWARQKEATMFTVRSALLNNSNTLEYPLLHLQSKKKTDSFFETLWRILPKTMVSVQTQVKSFIIDHLHITLCVLYWLARGLNSPSITSHPLGISYASSIPFPFLYYF
jgi:hypothetical protein